MTRPLISVIITAFNRREYVKDAVNSVIGQQFPREEYELIVSNNFSDSSFDSYCQKNDIINFHCEERAQGAMLARSIERASGELVCFLDDDDLFEQHKLESLSSTFSDDPSLIYYHNDGYYVDAGMERLPDRDSAFFDQERRIYLKEEEKERRFRDFLKFSQRFGSSFITARRSFLQSFAGCLERTVISPDIIITNLALMAKGSVLADTRKLSVYRVHNQQWSNYRKVRTREGLATISERAMASAAGYELMHRLALELRMESFGRYLDSLQLARNVSYLLLRPDGGRAGMWQYLLSIIRRRGFIQSLRLSMDSTAQLSFAAALGYLFSPPLSRALYMSLSPVI